MDHVHIVRHSFVTVLVVLLTERSAEGNVGMKDLGNYGFIMFIPDRSVEFVDLLFAGGCGCVTHGWTDAVYRPEEKVLLRQYFSTLFCDTSLSTTVVRAKGTCRA